MSLGELPVTGRVYYRLKDLTDLSGNARTLVNNNSVTLGPAKFDGGADFGSAGTNKSLTYAGGNVMSTLTPANITMSFWFKLNDATTSAANAGLVHTYTRLTAGTGACRLISFYNITGTTITITGSMQLTTAGNVQVNFSDTATTNKWYNVVITKVATNTLNMYVNGNLVSTTTEAGNDTIPAVTATAFLSIGNNATSQIVQSFSKIDEVIVVQRVWTASEVRKYYNQGKGLNAAQ